MGTMRCDGTIWVDRSGVVEITAIDRGSVAISFFSLQVGGITAHVL